jgi:serine/threonine protein kinase
MGEVYRARDSRLGRDVAIKVLPPGFSRETDRLLRFEQEARVRVPTVVRNVAFGGPKRQTLYMTGLDSLYRVQMLSQGPADRAK